MLGHQPQSFFDRMCRDVAKVSGKHRALHSEIGLRHEARGVRWNSLSTLLWYEPSLRISSYFLCGPFDRFDDVNVAGATAQVAFEGVLDLVVVGIRIGFEQM